MVSAAQDRSIHGVPPRQRGMAYRRRVAGAMVVCISAATLVGMALLPGVRASTLMVVCAAAALALGSFLVAVPRAAPAWASQLLIGFVTLLITVGIAAGDGSSSVADLPVLYVATAVYAFYFFSTRVGAAQVAFAGLCYGVCLAFEGGSGAGDAARWGTTVTGMTVAGLMVRAMTLEVERLVDELAIAATRDPLTGVWNRRGFDERLDVELARARRTGEPLTLLAADVDGLKTVNDSDGHAAGDAAIVLTARVLERGLRRVDSLGRVGGDEFLLLLPACDLASGQRLADELCAEVRAEARGTFTLSAGVVCAPPCALDGRALRAQADAALYAAKGLGRDRVVAVGADEQTAASAA